MTPAILACSACGEERPVAMIAWSADAHQTQLCARCARTREHLARFVIPLAREAAGDESPPPDTTGGRSPQECAAGT